MSKLPLSVILTVNDRTLPIIEGAVQPEGIDLTVTTAHPADIFWRQLHNQEFDVSEMSLSSLIKDSVNGDSHWVGLPIFTMREFFHTRILVRADAGIERPEDLKGKRVGVPEYQQTAALWVRAILKDEWGVLPSDFEWFMERSEERSHGGATGFQPPPGVRFHYIAPDKSIGSMLLAGELDATVRYVPEPNLIDRSSVDLTGHPAVRPLFPDPVAEGARYYQKTGIFPINHGMVVRRSLLERYPWIAINLYNAFAAARDMAAARTRSLADPYFRIGALPLDKRAALNASPFAYGVKATRPILDKIAHCSHEQGLTPRVLRLDEVFAPSTLDL